MAMTVLVWIGDCVRDELYNSKNSFLVILPVFFQLIVGVASLHYCQHDECFALLKAIISLSSSSAVGSFSELRKAASDTNVYTVSDRSLRF